MTDSPHNTVILIWELIPEDVDIYVFHNVDPPTVDKFLKCHKKYINCSLDEDSEDFINTQMVGAKKIDGPLLYTKGSSPVYVVCSGFVL